MRGQTKFKYFSEGNKLLALLFYLTINYLENHCKYGKISAKNL